MTKSTNAAKLYNQSKQFCMNLGLLPDFDNASRLLKSGATSVKGNLNYHSRKDIVDIALKPYTNEFGEQEAFGSICSRDLEYAEKFVEKTMSRFQGGVKNMTEASMHIIRCQRAEINKLKD
jgi:hypothetical protein